MSSGAITPLRSAPGIQSMLTRIALWNGVVLNTILGLLALAALRFQLLVRGNVTTDLSAVFGWLFDLRQGTDSWRPMLRALDCFERHLPIYQTVFFEQKEKFQYPLTSLLPMYLLRQLGLSDSGVYLLMNALTWCSLWITIALSIHIFLVAAKRHKLLDPSTVRSPVFVGSLLICTVFFYPLVKNYVLGQAQAFISMMFALALYSWLNGRYRTSGILCGLMCLIKPQYALLLIWFGLRKRFSALVAGAGVLLSGTWLASLFFGWREQLEYLNVLRYIAKRGESYWANESLNGFLNRLLFNGTNLQWTPDSFAPYSPYIYAATAISSACLIALALFYPFPRQARSGVRDFCLIAVAATVASPIAWEHHYGILLPVFAYLAAVSTRTRHRAMLFAAYVLTSHSWSPMNVFADVPVLNALQSLRFFGVLLLLVFLYRSMQESAAETGATPHGAAY